MKADVNQEFNIAGPRRCRFSENLFRCLENSMIFDSRNNAGGIHSKNEIEKEDSTYSLKWNRRDHNKYN